MALEEAASRAAETLRSRPAARWLLACDTDADGLAAGAVAAQALRKAGLRFTIRASRDKTEAAYRALFDEAWDGLVLLDKGSSHLGLLAELAAAAGRTVVVVDHHNVALPAPAGVSLLNPRAEGLDGSRDASASTTAVALALALCGDAAIAWGPTGLAGAVGDLQDAGGWRGWNKALAERSRAAGHLAPMLVPRLAGTDLAAAIAGLVPVIPGLAGDLAASAAFLESLGIEREADVEDLSAEDRTRLVSALLLRLIAAGQAPDDPRILMAETDRHAVLGASLRMVYRVADACGREGEAATGIAYLMGDKGARADALACLGRHRVALAEAMRALRADGLEKRAGLSVAWTGRADYTGLVAGRAMEEATERKQPVCILARRADGLVQASTRGTHAQVEHGMDLGRACAAAAKAAGGEGGGHPVAAGAVLPEAGVQPFLEALGRELADQGFQARLA